MLAGCWVWSAWWSSGVTRDFMWVFWCWDLVEIWWAVVMNGGIWCDLKDVSCRSCEDAFNAFGNVKWIEYFECKNWYKLGWGLARDKLIKAWSYSWQFLLYGDLKYSPSHKYSRFVKSPNAVFALGLRINAGGFVVIEATSKLDSLILFDRQTSKKWLKYVFFIVKPFLFHFDKSMACLELQKWQTISKVTHSLENSYKSTTQSKQSHYQSYNNLSNCLKEANLKTQTSSTKLKAILR